MYVLLVAYSIRHLGQPISTLNGFGISIHLISTHHFLSIFCAASLTFPICEYLCKYTHW